MFNTGYYSWHFPNTDPAASNINSKQNHKAFLWSLLQSVFHDVTSSQTYAVIIIIGSEIRLSAFVTDVWRSQQ